MIGYNTTMEEIMDNQSQQPKTAEDYLAFVEQMTGTPSPRSIEAVQSEVNELVKQVTVTEDGKFVYPENTPDHLKLAVAAEKKFRDTQSGYTKAQTRLKQIEEENKALQEQLAKLATQQGLPKEEVERLEALKNEDPDAWYVERQKAEQQYATKHVEALTAEQEIRNRMAYLDRINADREFKITPDVLDNDIPARINNRLINREVSFEAYIGEVIEYLNKGKAVTNPETPATTNLSGAGSTTVSNNSQFGGLDYSKLTF
ncbi:MAG: hypothetical protein JHC33_11410 [Ignisphaera sp.]|nr:hypothetical protein [Ignisphaera sp.]